MKINTKILVFYSKTFVSLHHQTITDTKMKAYYITGDKVGTRKVVATTTIIHGPKYPNTTIVQEVILEGSRQALYKAYLKDDGKLHVAYRMHGLPGMKMYTPGDRIFDGRESEISQEEKLIELFKESVSKVWGIGADHVKIVNNSMELIVETKFSALTFLDKFRNYNVTVEAMDRSEQYKYANPFKIKIPLSKLSQLKIS